MHFNRDFLQKRITQWPDLQTLQTPCYLYNLTLLDETLAAAVAAARKEDIRLFYALKANCNDSILERIRDAGIGADCVSGPEVQKAIGSGFPKNRIEMAGVGKTDEEILLALGEKIVCINVESIAELEVIAALAKRENLSASLSLRINPNIDAHTHSFITTGTEENKFGLIAAEIPEALEIIRAEPLLLLSGIHAHVGSQITRMEVFRKLGEELSGLNRHLADQGIVLSHINAGGGLGIRYDDPDAEPAPDFEGWFNILRSAIATAPGQEIWCEPGRSLTAQCGTLLTRVLYNKERAGRKFLIVDAGMTELIRPALYEAKHAIENLSRTGPEETHYEVAGPVCESSDFLGKDVLLPFTQRHDLLAIRSTGAYGETMSSGYNLRKKAAVYYFHETA